MCGIDQFSIRTETGTALCTDCDLIGEYYQVIAATFAIETTQHAMQDLPMPPHFVYIV